MTKPTVEVLDKAGVEVIVGTYTGTNGCRIDDFSNYLLEGKKNAIEETDTNEMYKTNHTFLF